MHCVYVSVCVHASVLVCIYMQLYVYTEGVTYVMYIGITRTVRSGTKQSFWSKMDVVKVITMQLQIPWSELPNLAIVTVDSKYLSGELRLRQNVEEVQNHIGIELSYCQIILR